tara:strand:+ start:59 stop:787 length:729 start_codon:yes stop_codon:yes gene_type:complete
MSKQVKLKFKKLLKKAEFVQADLEYHQELLPEAKIAFADALTKVLASLSAEDQKAVDDYRKQEFARTLQEVQKEKQEIEEETTETSGVPAHNSDKMYGEEFPEGHDLNPEPVEEPDFKTSELKKIFYQIADLTHPDKNLARGLSRHECVRLEKVFRKANKAYKNRNWFVLYSIAVDFNIPIDDPTEEHLAWVEEDIRQTLGEISKVSQILAWIWYVGDDVVKNMAMANYMHQAFNYDWKPDL